MLFRECARVIISYGKPMLLKIERARQAGVGAGAGRGGGGGDAGMESSGSGGAGQDAMDMQALADAVLSMHESADSKPIVIGLQVVRTACAH